MATGTRECWKRRKYLWVAHKKNWVEKVHSLCIRASEELDGAS